MNTNRVNQMKTFTLASTVAAAVFLAGCGGGGGGSTTEPVSTLPGPVPVVIVPVAVAPAPLQPLPVVAIAVSTLPAGTSPTTSAADCMNLQSAALPMPILPGADAQAASDILALVDPAHGFAEISRVPSTFVWWMRSAGPVVNMTTLGLAIHEANHEVDRLLSKVCSSDGMARFFADGKTYVTGLAAGTTANYSIVGEVYPAALKASRASRFDVYIAGSAPYAGNRFSALLDELNAYSSGAKFEVSLLSNPSLKYAERAGDLNVGGMVDFMLYMQAYLQASRLNHPSSYAVIQGQAQTLAYMQFAWTRAENILASAYQF